MNLFRDQASWLLPTHGFVSFIQQRKPDTHRWRTYRVPSALGVDAASALTGQVRDGTLDALEASVDVAQ